MFEVLKDKEVKSLDSCQLVEKVGRDKTTMSLSDLPTIPEWYRGSRVLITGGSGFMGKVLVEKLLRSCPDLDTIYLLLRLKKGKPPSSRIQDITSQPLFDKLRHENPGAFNKLVAVAGDVAELGLGLSDEDRRTLQQQVDVVFHSAASVRFDDPIRDAILINVRGTREVVNLALGMENLKVLLHLSTTYCNYEQEKVLEQLYPAPGGWDWRRMIDIVEGGGNDDLLQCLTPKILGKLPNTYTYAKALSEQIINDHKHQIPVVIVRPSIVVSTHMEPMPGWNDNFNGPSGLMVGGGKGILRSVYADPCNVGDYVPVDMAIKSMIFLAWHRAMISAGDSLPIYNSCSMTRAVTLSEVINEAVVLCEDFPIDNVVWYPNPTITHNRFTHYLKVIFYHMLPAILVDRLLKLSGRQPFLAKIQRRIYIANMAVASFIVRDFYFGNVAYLRAQDAMLPGDVERFGYNVPLTDKYEFIKSCVLGGRVYLLKDPLATLPHARMHTRRMYWLDRFCKTSMKLLAVWMIVSYSVLFYQSAIQQHVYTFSINYLIE